MIMLSVLVLSFEMMILGLTLGLTYRVKTQVFKCSLALQTSPS